MELLLTWNVSIMVTMVMHQRQPVTEINYTVLRQAVIVAVTGFGTGRLAYRLLRIMRCGYTIRIYLQ